jgi:hypothetical protein
MCDRDIAYCVCLSDTGSPRTSRIAFDSGRQRRTSYKFSPISPFACSTTSLAAQYTAAALQ